MAFFLKLKFSCLSKMQGNPQFSFWIPRVLAKVYFLQIVLNRKKNIPVLVSFTDRKPRMRRMYAQ